MPITGVLHSAVSDGYVVSDSRSNDVLLRSIGSNSRILVVPGCNATVSCASFSTNGLDVNVDLTAKTVLVTPLVRSLVVDTPQLRADAASASNASFLTSSVSNLNAVQANLSNVNAPNLRSVYSELQNVSSSVLLCSNAAVDQVNAQRFFANALNASNVTTPELTVTIVKPILGTTVQVGDPSFNVSFNPIASANPCIGSSTNTLAIIGTLSSTGDVVAANVVSAPNVNCNSNVCDVCSTNLIADKSGTMPSIAFDPSTGSTRILSQNLVASNAYVQQKLRIDNSLDLNQYSIGTPQSNLVVVERQGSAVSFDVSSNTASVRTDNQQTTLSLGVGNSNSLTISSSGSIGVLKPMIVSRDVATSFGDFSITGRASSVLSVTRTGAPDEIVRMQVNATNRGGCVAFSNVDAGARVVLWQDDSDVNAFGGLGKEPGLVVLRTPPAMGISFVGGNGATGSEHARFSASNGMLGVGVSLPTSRVHVRSSNDEIGLTVENSFAPSSTSSLMRFSRAVNVGNAAPPSVEFFVNGAVVGSITHPNGTTFYGTTSDIRSKNVLGPLSNADNVISRLNPVVFTMKNDVSSNVHAGFVADEVRNVIPNAVFGGVPEELGKSTYLSLDQTRIIPFLVAAVQSLQDKVSALLQQDDSRK